MQYAVSTRKSLVVMPLLLAFGGCAEFNALIAPLRPVAQPAPIEAAASVPVSAANTADSLDKTTAAQRAQAARQSGGGRALGRTVVSLGTPTEPGFWLKTPLVTEKKSGQVRNPATGKTVTVTLIPIEGPKTAGSRMSLAAMRLLGIPLTDLAEIDVRI